MGIGTDILAHSTLFRFHTPGHCGSLPVTAVEDITELTYSDNLLSPNGVLLELEQKTASLYCAESCFLSTSGATCSIQQAIYACRDKGAFLLVGNTHLSFYHALRILKLTAYRTRTVDLTNIPNDVGTVVLTSPDYFGNALPLARLVPSLQEKGLTVLIDAAHGSHFIFSDKFPVSATAYGDLVVHSLHKTLPVLTGASALLAKGEYFDRLTFARTLFHSTSPAYLTLCSIERMVDGAEESREHWENAVLLANRFRTALPPPFSLAKNDDPTRLVLHSPYDGDALLKRLLLLGFSAEMSVTDGVVLIVTPSNASFLSRLLAVLREEHFSDLPPCGEVPNERMEAAFIPLWFGERADFIPIEQGVGRRLFYEVGIYPPGTPLLHSGDVLTASDVSYLLSHRERLSGLVNGKLPVVQ